MPLLNQEDTSRLLSVLHSARESSFDSTATTLLRALAPAESIKALACLILLLKVRACKSSTVCCLCRTGRSCSHTLTWQEHTVLQLPERLAAHFLLWQKGTELPVDINPFVPILVEVGRYYVYASPCRPMHVYTANIANTAIWLQTACASALPVVEREFVLNLLSGTLFEQVSLVALLVVCLLASWCYRKMYPRSATSCR